MNSEKTQLYFVPGLAAGKAIFKNIHLPEEKYECHFLEWLLPEKNEPLVHYAKRMAAEVEHPGAVLIGVSFGGIVAQEMAGFLQLKKLIVVSSVKTKFELPRRFAIARRTKAYRILPTRALFWVKDLTKLAIGPKSAKRLKLYQEYLHVRDKNYMDWAIKTIVEWPRTKAIPGVVHLHGTHDAVFPVKNLSGYVAIENGTHIMLLVKGKEVSAQLLQILEP